MNDRLITRHFALAARTHFNYKTVGYRSVAIPTSWARVCTLLFVRKVLQIILNGAFGDTRATKIDGGSS